MATQNETNIKILFRVLQPGCVVTPGWLEACGISKNLQNYYLKSGWLESIGRGAYKRPGDDIEWKGALSAIQNQTNTKVHVGGLTALELQGFSHYLRMSKNTLQLFSPLKTKLPKWFAEYEWKLDIEHHLTSYLPSESGIMEFETDQFKINVSTPERAILECLLLAPQKMDLVECYHILEGLVNLKPKLLNELLVSCDSVKVRRLFLYLAHKTNHQWVHYLEPEKIDLGKGNRMLEERGVYIPKYLLSVPKELADL